MMITLQSPAKINLFLRVVGRYPDGRPETAVLSQAVDLFDTLRVSLAEQDSFECIGGAIPYGPSNSISQALDIFRRKTGDKSRFKIILEKKIPLRAGLCGRSSNAATLLYAINQLVINPVDVSDLKAWSLEIAEDVPFFFTSGMAFNAGNEGQFEEFFPFSKNPLVIVSPKELLPQAKLFRRLRLDELEMRNMERAYQEAKDGRPEYFNDLEEPAFAIFPKLALLKERLLRAGFEKVVMTGGGPALVCHGTATAPALANVLNFKVNPVSRRPGSWYE